MSLESRLKASKITYSDIQKILNKKYDAVRKAVKRESFSDLELKEIASHFDVSFYWLKEGDVGALSTTPDTGENPSIATEENAIIDLIESLRTPSNEADIDLLINEVKTLLNYKEVYLKTKLAIKKRLKV